MPENVLKLKKRAVALGMSRDDAREAGRKVLEAFIADAENGGTSKSSKPAKKAVKKAVAKKKAENKKATKPKSTKAKPKSSTKKASAKPKRPSKATEGVGRAAIGSINWTVESDDWNPRKGSPVEGLFKALKRAKGNVDKAFDAIVGDMYDFVGRKKRDGTKRTKAEAEAMLRYRLNRTKYEYATRTGQHEQATDRVEYGTGQYAKPKPKRKASKAENKRKPAKRTAARKSSAKKGGTSKRKAGSKKK